MTNKNKKDSKSVKHSKKTDNKEMKSKNNSKNNEKIEFNFDINKLKKAIPFVFILIIMAFAFYVRSGPITLNGMDDRIAANTYAQIKSLISQDIAQKYQNLDPVYRQELIDKEFKKVQDSGIYELNGQKLVLSDIIKQNQITVKNAFKGDNGQTYLNAIDPYYWLRKSNNLVNLGTLGDEIINGQGYETKQLAPTKRKVDDKKIPFQIWLESKLFKKNSPLMDETSRIFLIPVILVLLAVIPIYFIIRKYSNDYFALFGSLLLVSIGTYVSRTVAGFVDTDGYVVLFPLIITALLIHSFTSKSKYLIILLAILAGFFQGLFLWAWSAGWFIFIFLTLSLLGYLGYSYLVKLFMKIKLKEFKSNILNDLITLVSFFISSFIFTYVFIKSNIFKMAINGMFSSISGIASINHNMWPNVFTSVAELNPASFGQIISSVGGSIVFLIAMLGLLLLSINFKELNSKHVFYKRVLGIFSVIWFLLIIKGNFLVFLTANHPLMFLILLFLPILFGVILSFLNSNISEGVFLPILLSIWMSGTIYMSLNGVRFILLLGPAFAISFGIGLYYLTSIINNFFIKELNIKNKYKQTIPGFVIVSLLFLVLFYPMATQAIAISNGTAPNFDDAWYSAMHKIENNSNSNAIITSWWDFGHFFAAVSHRGVTFDGGSQTTPRSYWVGRLLMENNESKAHDILRMLVCGGNEAHNTFLNYTEGTSADVVKVNKVIISTLGKNISETRNLIANNKYYKLNSEEVDNIMKYLACEKPVEDFLITSGDMVGKAGVWAHWGSWDFTKKYVYDYYKTMTPEEIAKNIDENVSLINKYIDELKAIKIKADTQNIKEDNLVNQWFAPYPSYIPIQGQYEFSCQKNINSPNLLVCQNGVSIDLQNGKVSSQYGDKVKFNYLYFPSSLSKIEKIDIGNGDIDLVLIPSQSGFKLLMAQSPLGGSLFTKLYYLNGIGTEYFEKFDDKQSMTGNNIKVWKVLWDLPKLNETNSNEIKLNNSNNLNVKSVEYNSTSFNTSLNDNESLNNLTETNISN